MLTILVSKKSKSSSGSALVIMLTKKTLLSMSKSPWRSWRFNGEDFEGGIKREAREGSEEVSGRQKAMQCIFSVFPCAHSFLSVQAYMAHLVKPWQRRRWIQGRRIEQIDNKGCVGHDWIQTLSIAHFRACRKSEGRATRIQKSKNGIKVSPSRLPSARV